MDSITELYQLYLSSEGVSTDTRKIRQGEIYFALKGENFDGNKFASDALEKGALIAVVSDAELTGSGFFNVPDTLVTLQQLAVHHRSQLDIPFLGITGSNGKTTTKELITAVLERQYNVLATKGNLNNHIGVPLTLLSINKNHEFAVIEMGANHVGEIALLSSFSRPTHGLITNIGRAHIEGFGGVEGIKRGKSELYDSLSKDDGVAFINMNEKFLEDLSGHVNRRIRYGFDKDRSDFDYCFELLESSESCRIGLENGAIVESELFGDYNANNISTALAVGSYFGVSSEDMIAAVAGYRPENNRSQILEIGKLRVILDAYNANPTSMRHALLNFDSWNGTKAVVLGGMNELGDESFASHKEIVDLALGSDIERIILVGHHYHGLTGEGIEHYESTYEACEAMKMYPIRQNLLLIKGSRSYQLESLVDCLQR